ncbi:TolC family outer membrane protein [Sphingomonas xinjiangensis]|uniref:Outer membrane protein n=1 Tax=Sphingomonas xinjiangensis TaxID=643568 RepID=A0A840YSN9_9SPHN|nr:TolC family outer membrane protein [Sphingomonas xinjiangensis]MBB5712711.1 outer membrane protein [Sphingomonas xinjiangensis]
MPGFLRISALFAALPGLALWAPAAAQSRDQALNPVHGRYPAPTAENDDAIALPPNEDLASAIAEAYASNPALAASRYDLRATDDNIGIALSRSRATVQLQTAAGYDYTDPGVITQASRPLVDRLNNPNIERNDVTTQLAVDQPLWTGGRARAETLAARADSAAGRETLRGLEGDLLVDLIAAYADVRRDTQALRIRERNVHVLNATLDEVVARREAGELTRTDIAQAETQLKAAEVQRTAAEAQLETSRSSFASIVGRAPGRLAPEPQLPLLPASVDEAFATAVRANPDLAAAMANERASRARIAGARAEGSPTISLRGTAGTNGPVSPLEGRDQDLNLGARVTLTLPLVNGGRVQALVAQAKNRNTADWLRIEATRRQVRDAVLGAWNAWASAGRNSAAQEVQLQAARIYYEGTFEEYREGLRSTFDVLFAQNQLRETEVALISSRRDAYVAQAALLRRIGQLDVARLLTGTSLYDPAAYTRKAEMRGALPWDPAFRVFDDVSHTSDSPQATERIAPPFAAPRVAPTSPRAGPGIVPASNDVALPRVSVPSRGESRP